MTKKRAAKPNKAHFSVAKNRNDLYPEVNYQELENKASLYVKGV